MGKLLMQKKKLDKMMEDKKLDKDQRQTLKNKIKKK